MSVRSRLARLERSFPSDGCPECGFREGDIRLIVICDAVVPKWPPEDLCSTCGGLKPPVRIVGPAAGEKHPLGRGGAHEVAAGQPVKAYGFDPDNEKRIKA